MDPTSGHESDSRRAPRTLGYTHVVYGGRVGDSSRAYDGQAFPRHEVDMDACQ